MYQYQVSLYEVPDNEWSHHRVWFRNENLVFVFCTLSESLLNGSYLLVARNGSRLTVEQEIELQFLPGRGIYAIGKLNV